VTSAFFDELTTLLESLVLQSGPVIVGGDINIHVDDAADADAARLAALFDAFDLQQHVPAPPTASAALWTSSPRSPATASIVWPLIHPA